MVNETEAVNANPRGALTRVGLLTVAFIGFWVFIGVYVESIVGSGSGGAVPAAAEGISPEAGEAIFWGKGKCSTCHAVADRGSAVRCPNLGGIGTLADQRAIDSGSASGTDYLVESLVDPAVYVVDGYGGDTMPKVYEPPISLSSDELQAVITYLQSLGGTVDAEAIVLPPEVGLAGEEAVPSQWEAYMTGDPEAGRTLFFDGAEGSPPCSSCHMVDGEGGDVGPELDDVVATRGPQYVIESILDPGADVVTGYDNAMPPVFADALTVRQIHDILAFLTEVAGLPVGDGA